MGFIPNLGKIKNINIIIIRKNPERMRCFNDIIFLIFLKFNIIKNIIKIKINKIVILIIKLNLG